MAQDLPDRLLRFDTAAEIPDLQAVACRGEEALSRLYIYEVDLLSSAADLDPDAVLGRAATIGIRVFDPDAADDEPSYRQINGLINRIQRLHRHGPSLVVYRVTVVPWLWLLTQTADCRMFRETTLTGIVVDGVFERHQDRIGTLFGGGWLDSSDLATATPFERDYCVQYEENDFNFVSRLLETEGISYYFRHQPAEAAANVLVLCRGAVPFRDCGKANLLVRRGPAALGHIHEWKTGWQLRSGGWSSTDFDFFGASTVAHDGANTLANPATAGLAIFDYAADFGRHGAALTSAHLENIGRVRLEEQECGYARADGESGCAQITPGLLVTVRDSGQNDVSEPTSWVVESVAHDVSDWSMVNAQARPTYTNRFRCLPAATPIRPERRTPKPLIHGWDTAVVVAGDDDAAQSAQVSSHDSHGRVRVRFNWDREAKASCWIRVSQISASAGYGALNLPHHGDEVLVAYHNGDPDRPLVVGRVYNGVNVSPVIIPATDLHLTVQSDVAGNQMIMGSKPGQEFFVRTTSAGKTYRTGHDIGQSFITASGAASVNYADPAGGHDSTQPAHPDAKDHSTSKTGTVATTEQDNLSEYTKIEDWYNEEHAKNKVSTKYFESITETVNCTNLWKETNNVGEKVAEDAIGVKVDLAATGIDLGLSASGMAVDIAGHVASIGVDMSAVDIGVKLNGLSLEINKALTHCESFVDRYHLSDEAMEAVEERNLINDVCNRITTVDTAIYGIKNEIVTTAADAAAAMAAAQDAIDQAGDAVAEAASAMTIAGMAMSSAAEADSAAADAEGSATQAAAAAASAAVAESTELVQGIKTLMATELNVSSTTAIEMFTEGELSILSFAPMTLMAADTMSITSLISLTLVGLAVEIG